MWDLANEYRLFRDDAWAEKMGAFVKQCDPYDHLTSTHGHGDFRFRTSPWADFAMYQSWDEHGGYDFMLKNREQQAKTGRLIPQVNEEYGYEDHYPQGWGENRKAPARSAENRARLAWEIYLAGGYQTTGERADRGTGWGPDTGGGWINGRGDDTMTMLELYGHIYDFFTSHHLVEAASRHQPGRLRASRIPSAKPTRRKAAGREGLRRAQRRRRPGGDLRARRRRGHAEGRPAQGPVEAALVQPARRWHAQRPRPARPRLPHADGRRLGAALPHAPATAPSAISTTSSSNR